MAQANEGPLAKVRKLLAKANNPACTPEEAQTAWDLADAIMVKYDLDREEVRKANTDDDEKIISVQVPISNMRPDHLLWGNICGTRGVGAVIHTRRGVKSYEMVGYQADIEFVELLVTSLMLQRERFLSMETRPERVSGKSFNHSFRVAFADRVYIRIMAARRKAETTKATAPGTALVLADKSSRTKAELDRRYPKVGKWQPITTASASGANAGREAGDKADVSGGHNNLRGDDNRALAQ